MLNIYFVDLNNSNELRQKIVTQYALVYNSSIDTIYYKKYIEYYYAERELEIELYRSEINYNFKIIVCILKKGIN